MYQNPYTLTSILESIPLDRDALAFTCILLTVLFALFMFCVAYIYKQGERDFSLKSGMVAKLPKSKYHDADNTYQHAEYRSDFM